MVAQHRELAQCPGDDEAGQQGDADDADVVDEMVGDVEQVEASRRREEDDRRDGRHSTDDPGCGNSVHTGLLAEGCDDDLQQADHRRDSCEDQGDEEEHAHDRSDSTRLADDLREGDEGQADTRASDLAHRLAGSSCHEAQGGEDAEAGQDLE